MFKNIPLTVKYCWIVNKKCGEKNVDYCVKTIKKIGLCLRIHRSVFVYMSVLFFVHSDDLS